MPSAALPDHEIHGTGPISVFLLHGAYGDGRYFDHTRDVLVADGHRVIVWACPGYRGSAPVRTATIDSHAQAAAALVRGVGGTTNVVLGHSMGGLIAPRAAQLAGDRVSGLVLSSTSPGLPTRTPEEQARFLAERVDPISDGMSVGEYAPGLMKTMMGPDASGPLVQRVIDVVCEMRTETFKGSIAAIMRYDGSEVLRALDVPTLLIAGELDPACPPDGMRHMAELLSDSEYHELPGVGHYGFAETPDEYHALVRAFLTTRIAG